MVNWCWISIRVGPVSVNRYIPMNFPLILWLKNTPILSNSMPILNILLKPNFFVCRQNGFLAKTFILIQSIHNPGSPWWWFFSCLLYIFRYLKKIFCNVELPVLWVLAKAILVLGEQEQPSAFSSSETSAESRPASWRYLGIFWMGWIYFGVGYLALSTLSWELSWLTCM